jgi:hypothetical protein
MKRFRWIGSEQFPSVLSDLWDATHLSCVNVNTNPVTEHHNHQQSIPFAMRDNTSTMPELEIHAEGNESDAAGKKVGILAAVLAVLLAVVTILSHRTHTAAIMHKSTANDEWAYYQANSIKSHIEELGDSILEVAGSSEEARQMRARFAEQKKKYDAQKDVQQEKARQMDESAEADEKRALRYDFGEGLLEIGLVLSSMYFISRKPMFPAIAIASGAAGVVIAATGFLL